MILSIELGFKKVTLMAGPVHIEGNKQATGKIKDGMG